MMTRVIVAGLMIIGFFFHLNGYAESIGGPAGSEATPEASISDQAGQTRNDPSAESESKDLPEAESKKIVVDEKTSVENQTAGKRPSDKGSLPDRRWIIHMDDWKKPMPVRKAPDITWINDAQKKRCTSLIDGLQENFRQARYYSIHGDACKTARFAKIFMELAETCRGECPDDYMEGRGFSDRIVRNLDLLYELGLKSCFVRVEDSGRKTVDGRQGAEDQKERGGEGERDRNRKLEVGSRRSMEHAVEHLKIEGPSTEDRGQKTEDRRQ